MKLNFFGLAIQRAEQERMEQAQQAVAEGWAPADHPVKCCPPDEPRRQTGNARSIPENARLRDKALEKAEKHQELCLQWQARIIAIQDATPRFDHGMLNTPLATRTRKDGSEREAWEKYHYHADRAEHYERLARKYQRRIELAR